MSHPRRPLRILFLACAVAGTLTGTAAAQMPDSPTGKGDADDAGQRRVVRGGPSSGGNPDALAKGFATAFSSGDFATLQKFYAEHATDEFRARRTEQQDRELYEKLYRDLGKLQLATIDVGGGRLRAGMRAERSSAPVTFDFELGGDKIQGFTVQVGGPPGGGSELALDLPAGADDATVAEKLGRALKKLAEEGAFSGVVLVARDGEPIFHRGYGMANREAKRPVSTEMRFDVGSITKLLTKIAIGQLAEAGKLSLDDTLAEVLPDYPNADVARRITLRQIVEHRSGLGDIFNQRWETYPKEKLQTPRDFFPLFADLPLDFEPGEGKAYSNAGYVVLGAVVEAVSGQPYDRYLEKNIFRPAGMSRSGFPLRDGSAPDLAVGYTRRGGEGSEPRPNLGMLPIRGCPAGSSAHTAEDLLKLERTLRADRLLGPGWTDWVLTNVEPAGKAPERKGLATHPIGVAGGGPGVSAILESNAELAVVVLSNLDPPSAERLGIDIYRALSSGS